MCGKCLYKKNCQFLATHKKVVVEGCTAFESEEEFKAKIKLEGCREFAERLKEEAVKTYYGELVFTEDDFDNLLKEMGCE